MGQEALPGAWSTPSLPRAVNRGHSAAVVVGIPQPPRTPPSPVSPCRSVSRGSPGMLSNLCLGAVSVFLQTLAPMCTLQHPCRRPSSTDPLSKPSSSSSRGRGAVQGGRLALTSLPGGGCRLTFPPDHLQTFSFLLVEIEDDGAVGMCRSHLGRGKGQTGGRWALEALSAQGTSRYSPVLLQPAPGEPVCVTALLHPAISSAFCRLPCTHRKEAPPSSPVPSESL